MQSQFPVSQVIDLLERRLSERNEVVLQAPPGSGKTTIAPLALLDRQWLGGKKILMLEPRRIAARAAAHRMAELMGETPGETVGYRMRLESRVGPGTKLEIVTEGVMTRMLAEDPSLADVGLVIFDEFHERSLDADLALALCLKGRELFREEKDPLKLLLMSATLDTERISALLSDAPVITAPGRMYPVEVVYAGAGRSNERTVDRTMAVTMQALRECPDSSLLVFLQGEGEIRRCESGLRELLQQQRLSSVDVMPLFGNLAMSDQQAAIEPSAPGRRKIVLATNIAETSLTIEGVDVVVDAGLVRVPVYDPGTGMTRLHTRRVSRASSEQRTGRAGRLKPGRCYRLWTAGQQQSLAPHSPPEITSADLTPLALALLHWGATAPDELDWLDAPPAGAWQEAMSRLHEMGAIVVDGRGLSGLGRAMAGLPVHPRLARLLIEGARIGRLGLAASLAAVLSDRNPIAASDPDLAEALKYLSGESPCAPAHRGWLQRTRQLARQYEAQVKRLSIDAIEPSPDEQQATGYLVACAYPDRIARKRHAGGYQLANGRAASLAEPTFGNAKWLAVAEVGGMARRKGDIIRSAAVLDEALFTSLLADQLAQEEMAEWSKREKRFVAERRTMIGMLVLGRERLAQVPPEAKRAELIRYVARQGLELLPWTARLRQWQARVCLLRELAPDFGLPAVDDAHLLASVDVWLGPWLDAVTQLGDFSRIDLASILTNMLTYEQRLTLDDWLPERLQVPSGSRLTIDYQKSPPVLAVKLQEMFGCVTTPAVAQGRVKLLVHLLSPAGRPVQVTQDLAGFWLSSYEQVRKEMKGRYPKHQWPEDPLAAAPTRRTPRNR